MVQRAEGATEFGGDSNSPNPPVQLNDLSIKCPQEKQAAVTSSDGSDCTASPLPAAGPNSSASQLRLAAVLAGQGRPGDALQVLRPALAKSPTDPGALCLQGACLAATGNKAQALAAYAGALAGDAGHVESLLGYAALLKESSQLEEALDFLEKAYDIACAGRDADGRQTAAAPLLSLPGAKSLSDQVGQALAMVLTDLGTHYKFAGKGAWQERYERAVAVCPTYAPALYNLGVAAAEAGRTDEALRLYGKAVELEPRYAEAWCNLGVVHKNEVRLFLQHSNK